MDSSGKSNVFFNPEHLEFVERMLRESRNNYESLISAEQELSFTYADKLFSEIGIVFGESQKISLKLKTPSGVYTNLGLLLSDQCPHIIKAAAFKDEDGLDFVAKQNLTGSLLMQIEYAYNFALTNIQTQVEYDGLMRIDKPDYPLIAVREALLNAIMHRDYSSNSATQFKIFNNRMEIVSFGGLVEELDAESFSEGISSCRNPNLANVLERLHLVESYGTGIPKILAAYKNSSVKPVFNIKLNLFKIMLPKLG